MAYLEAIKLIQEKRAILLGYERVKILNIVFSTGLVWSRATSYLNDEHTGCFLAGATEALLHGEFFAHIACLSVRPQV
jgi:hypothetical protein